MKESWRWFGPKDPISLEEIRQTGATDIVTALHELPNGVLWEPELIESRRDMVAASGLTWSVTESIPVHEKIKTAEAGWEQLAETWGRSAQNLAKAGVKTICYNFMPVLDWTRTDLSYRLEDGARALRFDYAAYVAFDLFILKRKGAEADYSAADIARAEEAYKAMTEADQEKLIRTVIAGLPGSEESYTLDDFRGQLARYDAINAEALAEQLSNFLKIVVPMAEEAGALLAIHPDDPPRPLFGLPRVVSTVADMDRMVADVPSKANGFTFCTGSFGVRADNDLPVMLKKHGDRVYFLHLRATKREEDGMSFHEAPHLDGDVDMVAVVKAALEVEKEHGLQIPFRPDHGHAILDDQTRKTNPGYPLIGRLRGLAEVRGIARALATL
ncbi:mannonate dehydratase [Martelella alba]|uniref:Mannonate dehydratase n=1 Tax=Martelella alba TaxID=2590451 RepID=A0A506UEM3_9HYPH|nr:mannonate dehydratase [Martelella alba]TPW32128.1 mannonate dehydratase [Martelella alba]